MLKNVLVGTDTAYTTEALASITAGKIGVYSQGSDGTYTLLTIAPTADQKKLPLVIAQGTSIGTKTVTLLPSSVIGYKSIDYAAPVPNVWNIGYDGSAYDLNNGVAGTYNVSAKNISNGNTPFPSVNASVYCSTTAIATSMYIASEAAKQINSQTALRAGAVMPENNFVFASVLSAETTVQLASTVTVANITATVTNGSPTVLLTNTGTLNVVSGGYIRIGHATTKTVPLYKVLTGCSTTSAGPITITLEQPYLNAQQALGTVTAGLAVGYIAALTGVAAGIRLVEFGNRFIGSTYLEAQPNLIMSASVSGNLAGTVMQNNSSVTKSYMGSAGTVTTGIYNEGAGTYSQIFKKELVAAGYRGFTNRLDLPYAFPFYSVSGTTYDTFGVQFKNVVPDYTATGIAAGDTQEILIALAEGSNSDTTRDKLTTIIGGY